jgi:hypothetical protein
VLAVPVLDDWLTEEETAAELRKTVRTLRSWRRDGIGPVYAQFGRTTMYHKDALRRYCLDQQVTPVRSRQHRAKATSSAQA